jgi:uncharacterized protein
MKKLWISLALVCFLLSANKVLGDVEGDYLASSKAVPQGKAPGLQVKQLSNSNGVREFVLVFAVDDEVLGGLTEFANKYNVKSASITAIGGFERATSGWYDLSKQAFKLHHMNQQMEVVSLIGNITEYNGKPLVHVHFAAALSDGKVEGGHMIEAYTSPTLEMFVTAFPTPVYKQHSPMGLNIINVDLNNAPNSK